MRLPAEFRPCHCTEAQHWGVTPRALIVPLWHGDTVNSCRVTSPLVRLVKEEERTETLDHSQAILPQN
ncbi:hypothetical protein TNCV_1466211 [Trichonephila clavipes]|nr:hypothetical protein TNCV_1466211 [Trichonephila clavipes]